MDHEHVLDSDSIGFIFTKAPAANRMEFHIRGLEAHAGVCPEKGINAIKVAGESAGIMVARREDIPGLSRQGYRFFTTSDRALLLESGRRWKDAVSAERAAPARSGRQ